MAVSQWHCHKQVITVALDHVPPPLNELYLKQNNQAEIIKNLYFDFGSLISP